jgi:hypothetical protein
VSILNGTEVLTAQAWIDDLLEGDTALMADATGGVWDGPADTGTPYPIVRYESLSTRIVGTATGGGEVMLNSLWLVRGVIDGNSYAPLLGIAERIQALLAGSETTVTSLGTIESCVREEAFQQAEETGGKQYRHLGGIYRVYVS